MSNTEPYLEDNGTQKTGLTSATQHWHQSIRKQTSWPPVALKRRYSCKCSRTIQKRIVHLHPKRNRDPNCREMPKTPIPAASSLRGDAPPTSSPDPGNSQIRGTVSLWPKHHEVPNPALPAIIILSRRIPMPMRLCSGVITDAHINAQEPVVRALPRPLGASSSFAWRA